MKYMASMDGKGCLRLCISSTTAGQRTLLLLYLKITAFICVMANLFNTRLLHKTLLGYYLLYKD